MGIHARGSGDRLRTIWTPEMDRYFIDLMLEQIGKGNRVDDHLFSKRAWKQMTFMFNTRFNFQYEKDVLKNRHKTLRNLYKAIRHLLDQKGFSWDETRQMVTADNKLWDDYIKANPDARSYRIRAVPNYHDLSRIYNYQIATIQGYVEPSPHLGGNAKATVIHASCSGEIAEEALHDILMDDDYDISVPEGILGETHKPCSDIFASSMTSRTRTYWQPAMDRYFVDLMLDQVKKGNQVDGLFQKRAWIEMVSSFNAKFGFNYQIDILKNRYKTLRRQYNVIKDLLNFDGFVWDDRRQMVTAEDCVWQDYIKVRTDARQYMTRPVPYYEDLRMICRELRIGDQHDEAADIKCRGSVKVSYSTVALVSSDDQGGDVESSTSHFGSKKNKYELEDPLVFDFSKRARNEDEGVHDDVVSEVVTAVSSSLAEEKKVDGSSSCIPIENVIRAIQELPDMDEDLVLDACDFLEDEKKAKTFLALDFKLRKKWLLRKLRPEQ